MFLPNGHPANKIEKVMLLSMWTRYLKEEAEKHRIKINKPIISAGMGKPTYPINEHTVKSYLAYWTKIDETTARWRKEPDKLHESSAVDYGDPRGDKLPRELMSQVMTSWYDTLVLPENILFTVGRIGGLHIIFETFNTHFADTPNYRVITPFPFYSAYANNPNHQLYPIEVMKEDGYKLTAKALEASIKEAFELAEEDLGVPRVVLICNPSNPLGNVITQSEMLNIAKVLRNYPDLFVVIDEAYVEMSYVDCPSLLSIAPDLKERLILLRSATKSLSASGERMAIVIVFNEDLLNEMINKSIAYFIHAPRSAQLSYAETMLQYDKEQQRQMIDFYQKKVAYVSKRLSDMGASMPDPEYKVEATFYVLGDFGDLFGLEMPKSLECVFPQVDLIKTDEDLAYYLLFEEGVMIAPMSYFGLAENSGYVRITCSAHQTELTDLMDRLESRLFEARKLKNQSLLSAINADMEQLKNFDHDLYISFEKKIANYVEGTAFSCKNLKEKNQSLLKLHEIIKNILELH